MEKIEEQLKKLTFIKMKDEERGQMRTALISKMMEKSPVFRLPIRSPWSLRYAPLFTKISAALLVIVLVGGGTLTFASEKSLPGDLLYPIKIGVVENIIEGSLIHTPEDVLNWQQKRLSRRIDEVKQLKKKGSISKKQAQVVTAVVKDHVSEIQTAISTLKDEGKTDVVLASAASLIPIVTSLDETTATATVETDTQKKTDAGSTSSEEPKTETAPLKTMMLAPKESSTTPSAKDVSEKKEIPAEKTPATDQSFTVSQTDTDGEDATASLEADLKVELKKIEVDVKAVADDAATSSETSSTETKTTTEEKSTTNTDIKEGTTPAKTTPETTTETKTQTGIQENTFLPKLSPTIEVKKR